MLTLRFMPIVFFVLFYFHSTYSYFETIENRNQDEVIQKIKEIPSHQDTSHDKTVDKPYVASGISAIMAGSANKYFQRGFIEKFITTEEGTTTHSLIKIHKEEKRPLIIFVTGIGSRAKNRNLIHFTLPIEHYWGWNVIVLESVSSRDWVRRNQRIITSGYEAGWDLYLKIKAIREDPKIAPFISEIHLLGMSLGGSDNSFALYFDSFLNTNYIDGGTLNLSSPANRFEIIKRGREKRGLKGFIIGYLFYYIYDYDMYYKYCHKGFMWIFRQGKNKEVMNKMFARPTIEYLKKFPHHFQVNSASHSKIKVATQEEFGEQHIKYLYNLDQYINDIKKPLLWINDRNDPIVDDKVTHHYFESTPHPENIAHLTLNRGGHGGFPHAFGGDWVINLLTTYFIYWGNYNKDYYEQWKRPYVYKEKYPRYLK